MRSCQVIVVLQGQRTGRETREAGQPLAHALGRPGCGWAPKENALCGQSQRTRRDTGDIGHLGAGRGREREGLAWGCQEISCWQALESQLRRKPPPWGELPAGTSSSAPVRTVAPSLEVGAASRKGGKEAAALGGQWEQREDAYKLKGGRPGSSPISQHWLRGAHVEQVFCRKGARVLLGCRASEPCLCEEAFLRREGRGDATRSQPAAGCEP